MKKAPKYIGRAGGEQARGILAGYVRYAALIGEQESALESGEMERFEELTREIAEARQGFAPTDAPADVGEPDAAAAGILRQALATNRRIQQRLAKMRRESGDAVRNAGQWRAPTRRYLEDKEETKTHIDVTS